MPEHLIKARTYRERAIDMRQLAAAIQEAEHRATLLKLADEYERMANAEQAKRALKASGAS
jgi:hypothetical protein